MSSPDTQKDFPVSVKDFMKTGEFTDSKQAFGAMEWALNQNQVNLVAEERINTTAHRLLDELRGKEHTTVKPESEVSSLTIEP